VTARPSRRPLPATVLTLAALALALSGCGQGDRAQDSAAQPPGQPRTDPGSSAGTGAATGTPGAPDAGGQPSGGQGRDDPPTPDPSPSTGEPAGEHGHGNAPPRTRVPDSALLDAATVGGVIGGTWRPVPAPPDSCDAPRPAGAAGSRTAALAADPRSVVQTVATHASPQAAVQAVGAVAQRLRRCGWTPAQATPLGEASARATRDGGRRTALVLAAEGVTVMLVGTGTSGDPALWDSLADVALGSSCPATPEGCH
jgi:hypothetical protein